MVKIIVDQDKCIGCGACAATCSAGFEMREGKAYTVKGEVEKLSCEEDAAKGCPVGAISVS